MNIILCVSDSINDYNKSLIDIGIIDGIYSNLNNILKLNHSYSFGYVGAPFSNQLNDCPQDHIIHIESSINGISDALLIGYKMKKMHNASVNITECVYPTDALLVAKGGFEFITFSLKRIKSIGLDPVSVLRDACLIYENYADFYTQIHVADLLQLCASQKEIREMLLEMTKMGVDGVHMNAQEIQLLLH